MPSVMTMAVSTMACGSGSDIGPSPSPTIGGRPAAPPATRNSRLAPLPIRMIPIRMRLSDRSRSR